jgi:carbamate kinase
VRVVVALGGHALLQRGQEPTIEAQRANLAAACASLAPVASEHELVVTHGNGPQVGLLALQNVGRDDVPPSPLDVLDAETQGMIGYLIEQELRSCHGVDEAVAALLTLVEVDPGDPAFADPTKPIGPAFDAETAGRLARELGWTFEPDAGAYRRVVASPEPKQILGLRQIAWLLERGCVVICAGGGGIPVAVGPDGELEGVEAVIDKDCTSALLARQLGAQFLTITTDADAVYLDWRRPTARAIRRVRPDVLMELVDNFDAGEMRPKVTAAAGFVNATGGVAAIGSLGDITRMLEQQVGTVVTLDAEDIELHRRDMGAASEP